MKRFQVQILMVETDQRDEVTGTEGRQIDGSVEGDLTLLMLSDVFRRCLELAYQKEQGYRGAWRSQGYMGNVARVLSKASRLRGLLWRDHAAITVDLDAVQDTLADLINLSAFGLLNLEENNRWGQR